MDILTIDPVRIFEIKGNVCKLLNAAGSATVGSNRTVLTAISGKIIRVMGWKVTSAGSAAGTYFTLLSASGGTTILNGVGVPPNNGASIQTETGIITSSGYCETVVGEGLYMNVGGADIYYNIFYLAYTP